MDNKLKFFDQTFKMLIALVGCAWGIYAMLVFFVADGNGCTASMNQLFTVSGLAAGVLSALPIVYGLARLFFWPTGVKSRSVSSWLLGVGAGIFIVMLILFALAISQYGCQ